MDNSLLYSSSPFTTDFGATKRQDDGLYGGATPDAVTKITIVPGAVNVFFVYCSFLFTYGELDGYVDQ